MNEMRVYAYLILRFVVGGMGSALVRFVEHDARHHGWAK